jgi:hypothetical protein
MTAVTPKTNRDLPKPRSAGTCALDATLGGSHVQSVKRFCKLILAMALLSVAGVGVVALKSAIWILTSTIDGIELRAASQR